MMCGSTGLISRGADGETKIVIDDHCVINAQCEISSKNNIHLERDVSYRHAHSSWITIMPVRMLSCQA